VKKYTLDYNKFIDRARAAVAEGCVLLKNDNHVLPLKEGTRVSVFGRTQLDYYKSGTGSGGKVNVAYVRTILDALLTSKKVTVNTELLEIYKSWREDHPFDVGVGWAGEPKSQIEMPLTKELVESASKNSDVALVIIGRSAGEDSDAENVAGSYLLQDTEKEILTLVREYFGQVVVLLNVGNIQDMKWVDEYKPDSVMYVWQGGMEGGPGILSLLEGDISPSGKIPDTIAYDIEDYPSSPYFGDLTRNYYSEDIYVGYRYFETFAKEKVMYPFGFGLSYTSFSIESKVIDKQDEIEVESVVVNTGTASGKEVVQIYGSAPAGKLGKPARELKGFWKTKLLAPGEKESRIISIKKSDFSSFDDSGITGYPYTYVLEAGSYKIYAGSDVRAAEFCGEFIQPSLRVVEKLSDAMSPVLPFERMVAKESVAGKYELAMEQVPISSRKREGRGDYQKALALEVAEVSDKKILLEDVVNKKATLDDFIKQLSPQDMIDMVKGEGMCSPKVTPGTAGAIGGLTDRLGELGIPIACCSDGPSGMRLDSGANAFSMPSGTLLACTFNPDIVTDLFEMEGLEMRVNRVDTLLGPGINIHRNPLNGRNFEYHSEDPYLTGIMAAAQLKGLKKAGVSGTMKHLSGNNQETARSKADSVISARALREIYLKGFEMAVKSGYADSIMTTYGAVNGIWTAGYKEQNTQVVRNEWGFKGIIMTDWWPEINDEGDTPSKENLATMIWSQNDLYMVVGDTKTNKDNLESEYVAGKLSLEDLRRSAKNICQFLLNLPCMERIMKEEVEIEIVNKPKEQTVSIDFDMKVIEAADGEIISISDVSTTKGLQSLLNVTLKDQGAYDITITGRLPGNPLAQVALGLSDKGYPMAMFSFHGSDDIISVTSRADLFDYTHYFKVFYSESGFIPETISFKKV